MTIKDSIYISETQQLSNFKLRELIFAAQEEMVKRLQAGDLSAPEEIREELIGWNLITATFFSSIPFFSKSVYGFSTFFFLVSEMPSIRGDEEQFNAPWLFSCQVRWF